MAFLGHVVSSDGIKVDPWKIESVQNWPRPSTFTETRSFLGGYCRHFVDGFSDIATPLTKLTHKGILFRWSDGHGERFQNLNTTLTMTPVLVLPSRSVSYMIYCDVIRVGIGCVLMHYGIVIAYTSC
ncbi:uncharacterized mitochondrial protein AtMg00860-like [Nicotiana tomentosiformis]|uniref:uncharacterized mitochondrial protein AtMg00860-like n=1 Tax=Nicotiana tomentosiformis TaxID=4098 RepID=UPI00388C35DE